MRYFNTDQVYFYTNMNKQIFRVHVLSQVQGEENRHAVAILSADNVRRAVTNVDSDAIFESHADVVAYNKLRKSIDQLAYEDQILTVQDMLDFMLSHDVASTPFNSAHHGIDEDARAAVITKMSEFGFDTDHLN